MWQYPEPKCTLLFLGWQGDAVSEPAVRCRGPGLARVQSPDGAPPGRPVTWDMMTETPETWLIHYTWSLGVEILFGEMFSLQSHQDWKRLRYKKLHSDLTFPELCLACAYLILHSFLEHSCFCLSKSFMWSLFIECAWSNFVLATSYLLHYYICIYHI